VSSEFCRIPCTSYNYPVENDILTVWRATEGRSPEDRVSYIFISVVLSFLFTRLLKRLYLWDLPAEDTRLKLWSGPFAHRDSLPADLMQLAQIVHYHGYPTNSVKGKEVQIKIRDGGKPKKPTILDCNKIRCIQAVSGFICRLIIDRVYALDPVGTYWLRTQPTFFGLNSKTLPPGVRARVILMAGEGKLGFQPNIYATESDNLKQVL
jgi:hypothetical protein